VHGQALIKTNIPEEHQDDADHQKRRATWLSKADMLFEFNPNPSKCTKYSAQGLIRDELRKYLTTICWLTPKSTFRQIQRQILDPRKLKQ
jgi:hypothetical protein